MERLQIFSNYGTAWESDYAVLHGQRDVGDELG